MKEYCKYDTPVILLIQEWIIENSYK
uniref:Uncharacterized protein n=1 Tax=Anguilla anguilla TaxID=7936 RepID=A0A0E9SFR3_ANGAN